MAKLPKFTLSHNEDKQRWELTKDGGVRPTATFDTKAEATQGGALEKAVGAQGGSVKIQKMDGDYQEERTFPRSADPKQSKG
jgi:hypothetical protein